jgi:hypothetical protein
MDKRRLFPGERFPDLLLPTNSIMKSNACVLLFWESHKKTC